MVSKYKLKQVEKKLKPHKKEGIIPSEMTFKEREQRRKELLNIPRIKALYEGDKSKILDFNNINNGSGKSEI